MKVKIVARYDGLWLHLDPTKGESATILLTALDYYKCGLDHSTMNGIRAFYSELKEFDELELNVDSESAS